MNHLYEYRREPYLISTDPARLDLDVIHGYLSHSYWSPGIPRELVERGVANSLNFGLYDVNNGERQIGLARIVTDYARFAYLADVFVLDNYRGQGLGVWLVDCVINCPALADNTTSLLFTRDAHALYKKFGFEPANAERAMMRRQTPAWWRAELISE